MLILFIISTNFLLVNTLPSLSGMLLGVTFGSAVLFVVIADAVDKDVAAAAAVGAVVAATVAAAGATAEVDVVAVSEAEVDVPGVF